MAEPPVSEPLPKRVPPTTRTIEDDHVQCNWGVLPREAIPYAHRPVLAPSEPVLKNLSKLALIAPGKQGLSASQRLITSAVRCRTGNNSAVVLEEDMQKAVNDMYELLCAVGDIGKVRRQHGKLFKHSFDSLGDPFDWPFEIVMALWDLIKLTGTDFSRAEEAASYVNHHFNSRIQKDVNSSKLIIESDIREAIDSLKDAPVRDPDTTLATPNAVSDTDNNAYFCTTGSNFVPCLPPLEILVHIGKTYYMAKKRRSTSSPDGPPVIMSYEMASKGMYHDNAGSKNLGTLVRFNRRNWSYKHFWTNWYAISTMEVRFGKSFYEIFECPDIQASQALRIAEGILFTLRKITDEHQISNIETLRKVCNDFFTKYPHLFEWHRCLTTDNVVTLEKALDDAKDPDDEGVKYKGWPSLGGAAAGPATVVQGPAPIKHRRPRELSPPNASEQPVPKRTRGGLDASARATYVANLIPEMDMLPTSFTRGASHRRASGPSATAPVAIMYQGGILGLARNNGNGETADTTAGANRPRASSLASRNNNTTAGSHRSQSARASERRRPMHLSEDPGTTIQAADDDTAMHLSEDPGVTTQATNDDTATHISENPGTTTQTADDDTAMHVDDATPAAEDEVAPGPSSQRDNDAIDTAASGTNVTTGAQSNTDQSGDAVVQNALQSVQALNKLYLDTKLRAERAERARDFARAQIGELKRRTQLAEERAGLAEDNAEVAEKRAEEAEKKAKEAAEMEKQATDRLHAADERAKEVEAKAKQCEKSEEKIKKMTEKFRSFSLAFQEDHC
ncbi:hypothetical protein SLS55_003443 [Diplodia seriata]|uniref:Uncharacterized protein n=1 Tax=Diplodia seriata TaxID=420778 RepID=A0ABR3CMZ9_9PEZI